MAAPTLTLLNSTSLSTAESTTGWNQFDTLDTDIKKEGNNGITGTFRADGTDGYYDNGSAPVTASGKTFRMWINTTSVPYLTNVAGGGMELLMYDGTTSEYITIFGNDTYFGGWYNIAIDPALFTTLTLANIQRWGCRVQYTTQAKNVDNVWVDALKYLDGYSMTGGTSGDEITLATIEAADRGTTTLYGYGVTLAVSGVYYCTGKHQYGTGSTTTWVLMDGDILVFEDQPIATGLYEISGVGTGTRVSIIDSVIRAAGTTDSTRFIFDMSDADLLTFSMTGSFMTRAAAISFKSGQTVTGNTFSDCGQIDANGADLTGSIVKGYEGTSDTGAVSWTPATDPNGELDNMVFEKGTASTHAIEFGISSPTTMTLTGIDFGTGYNASDGQTDSALLIRRTSGTVDIALVGCTGTIKYKSLGATVTLTASKSATFTPVENGSAFTITQNSDNSVLLDVASVTGGEVVYSYDGALDGTATTVHLIIAGKEPIDFPWTVAEGTVPISQVTDRVYSNP